MSSKDTTPEPTGRRGSARLEALKKATTAKEKTPAREKTPVKKATTKAAVAKPKAAGTKRKSATPVVDDLEGDTEIGVEESPAKKPKASPRTSPKTKEKENAKADTKVKGKKAPKKVKETSATEPVSIDPFVLTEQITQAIQAALPAPASNPDTVAAQVTKGVQDALKPYLDILDPFMRFQMLCNNRSADTALGAEIDVLRVNVLDKVRELKGEGGKGAGKVAKKRSVEISPELSWS